MRHLKFDSIGTNLWAVERTQDKETTKIAELAITQEREARVIPVTGFAYTIAELRDVCTFAEVQVPYLLTGECEMERARR